MSKKKLGIALLVGTAIFGAVFGMAASLGITSSGLGSSTEVVATCDADGITVDYTTAWDAAAGAYEVATVELGDIEGCTTGSVAVEGVDFGTIGTITAGSASVDISSGNVTAESLEDIAVVLQS